jgi:ketosteroid isomerase-like protein
MDPQYAGRFLRTTGSAAAENVSAPENVLHAAYEAVIRGDFDLFGESLADDAELYICGFGPLDGTWRGRDDVVAATRRNFALLSGQKPEVERIISQGGSIAALLRESGVFKSSGEPYSVRGAQFFRFADGKITRIDQIVASIWKVEK